jgi:hypothetical protein
MPSPSELSAASRQATLDELKARCEAYADSTGERCKHDAVEPFPYCSDHMDLLDDDDLRRIGAKPSKSEV